MAKVAQETQATTRPRQRFVPSAYILSAVAVIWTAGMLLLHFFFVGPRLDRQGRRMDQDLANQWMRICTDAMQTQRGELERVSTAWAHDPVVAAFPQHRQRLAVLDHIRQSRPLYVRDLHLALVDDHARVLVSWRYDGNELKSPDIAGQDLSGLDLNMPDQGQDAVSDIAPMPVFDPEAQAGRDNLALYARARLDGSGYSILAFSRLDGSALCNSDLLPDVQVGIQSFKPGASRSENAAISPWAGPEVARLKDKSLQVRKPLTNLDNRVLAMLTVRGGADSSWQQRQAVSASLLTTLIWAGGFALLMVVLIHAMISGPTSRLLHRVECLKTGEVGTLASGLRGEAMVLARKFEEVLGRAEHLSETDSLTGVNNRRSFRQFFVREFHRARRYNRPLSLAMLDLDYLKAANDVLGHQTGDTIIELFAQVIREHVRKSDSIARLGGDEFAVLMPETTEDNAAVVMERIRAGLAEKAIGRGAVKINPTTSIGVCDLNVAGADTPDTLLNLADRAMYTAKRSGRNQVIQASRAPSVDATPAGDQNKVDHLCRQLAGLDAKFKRLFVEAIGGLINAMEARDEHTANHSAKVRRYALMIAQEMKLPQSTVERIGRAAMLHDIGKIALPDVVLLKNGPLTPEEWAIVKRHPVTSVRIMEGMEFLDQEIPAVRYHHERFDGGGYPEGLSGTAIPLTARVLAVADAFDAMTSPRVYRSGIPVQAAVEELRKGSGRQFDPAVVDAFLSVVQREDLRDETIQRLAIDPGTSE